MDALNWLTLALVVITAIYAYLTFLILKANRAVVAAMQDQMEAALRPYVTAEVNTRPGSTLVQLVVKNTGKSAAESLRMSIDQPLLQKLDGAALDLRTLTLFAGTEVQSLAAGAELVHLIGVGHKLFNEAGVYGMPETFVVSAQYKFGSRTYDERHTIDVRPMIHTSVKHDPIATAIRDAAEKVVKELRAERAAD